MNKEEREALRQIDKKLDKIIDKFTKPNKLTKPLEREPEKNRSSEEKAATSFAERQAKRGEPKRGK
jgi:hypothetical protein